MASLTQWTRVSVNSRSWWWTGRLGMWQSMGSQWVGHDWATELNWIPLSLFLLLLLLSETDPKYSPVTCQGVFSLFLSRKFMVSSLAFRSLTILNSFSWGSVLISLFYIELFNFSITAYWTDCLFSTVYSSLLLAKKKKKKRRRRKEKLILVAEVCFCAVYSVELLPVPS